MALSNYAAYEEALNGPYQRCMVSKNALTTVAGRSFSSWLSGGFPAAGAAPTTAAVPTAATTGAWTGLSSALFNGTNRRILKAVLDYAPTVTGGGMLTICDRLSHQGALSATTIGAQVTNLPTAALTRKTSGVGVEIGLEVYSVIGTTGTVVSASYTDTGAAAGNATPAMTFGGTGFREASRMFTLPLAQGAVGALSVESVSATASTLTAGNFGVTLYYPLVHIPLDDLLALRGYADALTGFGTWFPLVDNDACLFGIWHMAGATTGVTQLDIRISEDR